MESRLIQFSCVIVGDTHNPTILNPDFLELEGIVPKSWGWEVTDTVTTPPFSMVKYGNALTITVESNKLQVTDPAVEDGPEKSKVPEIVAAYVKTLRHVRYKAVGINFQSVIRHDDPETYLKERFLKQGPWSSSTSALETVGLRLVYSLKTGRLTLSFDSGEAKSADEAKTQAVIIANANFNRECGKHPAAEVVCELLESTQSDWAAYEELLISVLSEGS